MKKNIVILGAGFGGLRAALRLEKIIRRPDFLKRYEIVIIDKNDFHTYTPLLYEVATTPENVASNCDLNRLATYDIRRIFRGREVSFVRGEVLEVDLSSRKIFLDGDRKIEFAYLITALGTETNFFDLPGIKKQAFCLKTYEDAIRLRNALIKLDNRFGPHEREFGRGRVIVCGGGPTGVELAAEIKNWMPNLAVTLIEGSSEILQGFDVEIIGRVKKRLSFLGVEIESEFRVKEAVYGKIFSEDAKETFFDILIWVGGVKTSSVLKEAPLKKETGDRIKVGSDMGCFMADSEMKINDRVYVVGDAACLYTNLKKPVPMVARAALDGGEVAAENIIREIKLEMMAVKETTPVFYNPKKDYPYVLPVGGKFAVVKIGDFVFSGFWGWVLKGLIEFRYLVSIMPFWKALKIWLKGLWVFSKNDRIG